MKNSFMPQQKKISFQMDIELEVKMVPQVTENKSLGNSLKFPFESFLFISSLNKNITNSEKSSDLFSWCA